MLIISRTGLLRPATAFFLLVLGALSANASPLDITNSDKIGDIIAKFRQAISEIIKDAGSEARATMMLAFQGADATVQGLATTYNDSLTKTFGELDGQQRKAFEDTQKAILNLDTIAKNGQVGKAINTAQAFTTVLNQIAGGKRPLIIGYEPANLAPSNPTKESKTKEVKISIAGFKLCLGDKAHAPQLITQGKEISTDGSGECTDSHLTFVLPRELFPSDDKKLILASAKLRLYFDNAHWWSPWSSYEPVDYDLVFNVLPNALGSYTYSTKSLTKKNVPPQLFSSTPPLNTFSHEGHSGDIHGCYPLDTKGGWKYDIASVKLVKDAFVGSENTGDIAIWNDVKTPYNICIRVTAGITAEEHWANSTGHLEVNKVLDHDEFEETSEQKSNTLDWDDVTLPLLQKATSQVIDLKLFDDIKHSVAATDVSILPYLKVVPDTRNGVVFLRPERDW